MKKNDKIVINDDLIIEIKHMSKNWVVLNLTAPSKVKIDRMKTYESKKETTGVDRPHELEIRKEEKEG